MSASAALHRLDVLLVFRFCFIVTDRLRSSLCIPPSCDTCFLPRAGRVSLYVQSLVAVISCVVVALLCQLFVFHVCRLRPILTLSRAHLICGWLRPFLCIKHVLPPLHVSVPSILGRYVRVCNIFYTMVNGLQVAWPFCFVMTTCLVFLCNHCQQAMACLAAHCDWRCRHGSCSAATIGLWAPGSLSALHVCCPAS